MILLFLDDVAKACDFRLAEAPASMQPHWPQPEFRGTIVALYMDMNRFLAIPRIEEKTDTVLPKIRSALMYV